MELPNIPPPLQEESWLIDSRLHVRLYPHLGSDSILGLDSVHSFGRNPSALLCFSVEHHSAREICVAVVHRDCALALHSIDRVEHEFTCTVSIRLEMSLQYIDTNVLG